MTASSRSPAAWVYVVLLLLLGFGLRVYGLTRAPLGLGGDEMFYYSDASRIRMLGDFRIYYPTNYGHEPLFIYAEALTTALIGASAFTLRYTAVLGGLVMLAGGYALARRMFNRRAALFTLALFAAVFWPLFMTRVGLRAFTYPLFTIFSIYAFWRALEDRSWRWAVAAGALTGLTLYTYIASRVFPAVIGLWLLAWFMLHRDRLAGRWRRIGVALALALLVAAPLIIFAWQNPDVVNQRPNTMGGPLFEIQRGEFAGLIENIGKVAAMFTVRGDPDGRYNADGHPVFDWVTGALFYIGAVWLLLRWRQPASLVLGAWLAVALAPTLLALGAPSWLRASGAMFPILVLAGVGFDRLWAQVARWQSALRLARWAGPVTIGTAVAVGALSTSLVFGPWRTSNEMMHVYESDLYLAARYLDQNPPPPEAQVFVLARDASDHAPALFELQSRAPQRVRWSQDLVWPVAPGAIWYLFTDDALPSAETRAWLGAPPVWIVRNQQGDIALEVYRLATPPPLPSALIPVQARFDHLLDLIGVNYPQPFVRGQTAEVQLFWRVRPDVALDLSKPPALVLTLAQDDVVWSRGGAAVLAYPPFRWRPGDIWLQRVKLDVPMDMPPQSIQPVLQLHVEGKAWPVIVGDDDRARTQLTLPPVQVTGQPVTAAPPASTVRVGEALALLKVSLRIPPYGLEPGLRLVLHTTWQALRQLDQDDALQIEVTRPDGNALLSVTQPIYPDLYPTSRWQAGEMVTSHAALQIPLDAPGGDYQVRFRVVRPDGQPEGDGAWLDAGPVSVAGRPHVMTAPPVDVALEATVGDIARLVGYRLNVAEARPGGAVRVTLIWQALRPSDKLLKVFTHLYGLSDTVLVYAQHDSEPAEGRLPTPIWLPGEYIEDEHVIPLDASLPVGTYRLGLGMYDPELLQRLPIQANGQTSDALILTELQIR